MNYRNNSTNITKVLYGPDLTKELQSGIEKLATIIASTLGPRGKNVIINNKKNNIPFITNDGATIAKSICLDNDYENAAVQLLKQAALKTESDAGDGTSTAIVLANAIIMNTRTAMEEYPNLNVNKLKRDLDYWLEIALGYIDKQSFELKTIDEVRHIATISANNDESIGNIIAEAIELVGNDGIINVEESQTGLTEVIKVVGMEIKKPIISPYFINNQQKGNTDFNEETYILIIDDKVYQLSKLLPALQAATKSNKPILIIAENIEGEALSGLVVNAVKGNLKVCAIEAPHFGDERRKALEDIAKFTGATILSSKYGPHTLDNFENKFLGVAKRVTAGSSCVIQEGKGTGLEAYKEGLKHQLKDEDNKLALRDKEILNIRLANLSANVAVLKVGASTDAELIEKKMRIDDAIRATKCAIEEGIITGGGMSFYKTSLILGREWDKNWSDETSVAKAILQKSLQSPLQTIIQNYGGDENEILIKIFNEDTPNVTFNANDGKIVNAFEHGIIDPVKVVKSALTNAVSIAGMIITTTAAIIYDKEKNNEYISY